jgi:hypothetical protein
LNRDFRNKGKTSHNRNVAPTRIKQVVMPSDHFLDTVIKVMEKVTVFLRPVKK